MTDPTFRSWQRIEEILHRARSADAAARPRVLNEACGSDSDLRAQVERLLAAADVAPALEQGPRPRAPRWVELPAGTAIGAYRIVRIIGRGGMGEVYLAERADGRFQQQVAVKLMRPEAREHLNRFEAERRILARLEHPGIARLLDAGVTAEGRPFMLMEYVEGQALLDHCSARHLDLPSRLRLLQQICDAVIFAHANLVVHRDLKSANILVTRGGAVKLLDFGIAKLLDPGADLPGATVTGVAPLTPDHAAPEQLEGKAITTATDVYALGIVLFELLAGRSPWQHLRALSVAEALRQLLHDDPPPPSSLGEAATGVAVRDLRGDLDAIVAKALRKLPQERYPTVNALRGDIERYLANEAISARPASGWYRLRKFARRNRGAMAAAVAVTLAIGAGIAGVLWQAQRAQQEAERARSEAARATATKNFLIDVFRASDPRIASDTPRGQITAKQLMDLSVPRIRREFAADPATQIELLELAASIYREFNDVERFQALNDQVMALARSAYGELHPAVARGYMAGAHFAITRSDHEGALALLDQADPLLTRAGRDQTPQRAAWWGLRGRALYPFAERRDERFAALERAVALYEAVAPRDPGLVQALNDLGTAYGDRLDSVRSRDVIVRAIALAESLPDSQRSDADLISAYGSLAMDLSYLADYDGTVRAYERAVAIARKTYGERDWRIWALTANRARFLHMNGDRALAMQLFQELLAIMPAQWPGNTDDDFARENYATSLMAEGRAGEAIPILEAALRVYREQSDFEHDVRRTLLVLGDAYLRAGRGAEARNTLAAALEQWTAHDRPDSQWVLRARDAWARLLYAQKDPAGAVAQWQEIITQAKGRNYPQAARAHGGLARVALDRGDATQALAQSRRAVEVFEGVAGSRDVRVGPEVWLVHSEALRRNGDAKGALEWAQRALAASRKYDVPRAPSIGDAEAAVRAATEGGGAT